MLLPRGFSASYLLLKLQNVRDIKELKDNLDTFIGKTIVLSIETLLDVKNTAGSYSFQSVTICAFIIMCKVFLSFKLSK